MKEETDIKEINLRISEILQECKSEEAKEKLQTIYNTLNGKNSLQVIGIKEKLRHYIRSFSGKYRKQVREEKIQSAKEELYNIIEKYIVTDKNILSSMIKDGPISKKFSTEIDSFLEFNLGFEFKEDTIKVYDRVITDSIKKESYTRILKHMSRDYFEKHITIEELLKTTNNNLKEKEKKLKEKCKDYDIECYYGSKEFMEGRIEFVKECMQKLLMHSRFQNREDIISYINRMKDILQVYNSKTLSVDSINKQRETYVELEELYKEVLEMENMVSKDVEKVWKEKITSVSEYSNEGHFAFLAHTLSKEEFLPEDMNKLCMTYITENTLTLPYGNYGLIYPINMNNIIAMSSGDAGSFLINKKEFINQRFEKTAQYTEPIDELGNRMRFEFPPTYSTLLLPDDIEEEIIKTTIKCNGEMLNYDSYNCYNEVIITNKNKDMYPVAVFAKVLGNQDYSEAVKKAKKLSEKLGIPYIEIDKTICRERLGLDTLTDEEEKKFEEDEQSL